MKQILLLGTFCILGSSFVLAGDEINSVSKSIKSTEVSIIDVEAKSSNDNIIKEEKVVVFDACSDYADSAMEDMEDMNPSLSTNQLMEFAALIDYLCRGGRV